MSTLCRVCLAATLTVVACGLLPGIPAIAQSPPHKTLTEDSAPASANPSPGNQLTVEAKKLDSVLGIGVRSGSEQNVGRIVDLLADREGRIEAAVIEFGGFLGMGTRKIAIEWSALRIETSGKQAVAVLDMTRDQLRSAPEYKADQPAVVVRRAVQSATPPQTEVAPSAPPAQSELPERPRQAANPPPSAKQAPRPRHKRRHRLRDHEE